MKDAPLTPTDLLESGADEVRALRSLTLTLEQGTIRFMFWLQVDRMVIVHSQVAPVLREGCSVTQTERKVG